MQLTPNIKKWQIDWNNINNITNRYEDYHVFYIKENDLRDEANWFIHYYLPKDTLEFSEKQFDTLLEKLYILNNIILKKVVYNIMLNPDKNLTKLLFSEDVQSVLKYSYFKNTINNYNDIQLSYFWRYDLLLDKNNNVKIVELNSETPAWMPESMSNIDCVTPFINFKEWIVDANNMMEENIKQSIYKSILWKNISNDKNLLIVFWAEKSEDGHLNDEFEDYTNVKHLTAYLKRQFPEINIKLAAIDDIELKSDWIYYFDSNTNSSIKQDYIWSFYPLEWLFIDNGWSDFWELYKNNKFDIINSPLNLITQNKMFWAYIYEDIIGNNILTEDEEILIKELTPVSSYINKEWFIKKPLLYREWIWIDDETYIWDAVYQEKIDQQQLFLDTFYWKDWKNSFIADDYWLQPWYMTLWIYYWEIWYLWVYNRFCENFITDDTSYYVPTYIRLDNN